MTLIRKQGDGEIHSDDTALAGNPEFGWGWCADNFDIIQTDWVGAISQYLDKTGKRWR